MAPAELESIGPFYLIRSVCFEMFVEERSFSISCSCHGGLWKECIPCIPGETPRPQEGKERGEDGSGHFSIFDDPHVSFNHNQSLGITTQGIPFRVLLKNLHCNRFSPSRLAGRTQRKVFHPIKYFLLFTEEQQSQESFIKVFSIDPRNKNIYILNLQITLLFFPLC